MRPVVKKRRIALFTPQGFLDGISAMQIITIQDMQTTMSLNVSMVLVSLKKVVFFNKNGITSLLDIMQKMHKEMNVTIGFCDYNEEQYRTFFKFFDDQVPFSLFKTIDIALIFAGGEESKDEESVLVYNEDSTQRSMQAIEIYDRGYNPVVVQNEKEYYKRLEDRGKFKHVVHMTYLGWMSNKIAARTKGNCVIYYLKGFLDGTISEQFDIVYHQNCLKVGFQLFMFDATRVSSLNIHATNFFSKLSTAGAEYGALISIVGLDMEKTPKRFVQELEDAGIMFFEKETEFFTDKTVLSMSSGGGGAVKKDKGKLTKTLVSQLPTFMDATIGTLQMMTNMIVVKEGMSVQSYEPKLKDAMASSIAFYGDIDGMITLVMSKELVKSACKLLIGEESDDNEVLDDALGELVNIVAGKSKSMLQEKGISVTITLPRSYRSIKELKNTLSEIKGIQVNFTFDQYPFTFYLNP
jgi:CheY-specific phosphatase CheX